MDALRRADSLKRTLDEEAAKGAREQAKRQRLEQDVKACPPCSKGGLPAMSLATARACDIQPSVCGQCAIKICQ